ncbi:hypothetical protein [Cyclobacterium xiamenense]|jgi:hypothetical protein|uniref:hypothetical protein n=1 Tax=Cyclobacterium xiamenense TaxID=1297121 RepID=UPI0035CF5F8B
MTKSTSHTDQMTAEMYRLLKIFGSISVGLVLLLSFFNEYRANNSGEETEFTASDAGLIYFNNIRKIDYHTARLPEAMIDRYTHQDFDPDSLKPAIHLDLIVHKNNMTAVPYLVPKGGLQTSPSLLLRAYQTHENPNDSLAFQTGDRQAHLQAAKKLYQWLAADMVLIEAKTESGWETVLSDPKERKAFIQTVRDYEKITSAK